MHGFDINWPFKYFPQGSPAWTIAQDTSRRDVIAAIRATIKAEQFAIWADHPYTGEAGVEAEVHRARTLATLRHTMIELSDPARRVFRAWAKANGLSKIPKPGETKSAA